MTVQASGRRSTCTAAIGSTRGAGQRTVAGGRVWGFFTVGCGDWDWLVLSLKRAVSGEYFFSRPAPTHPRDCGCQYYLLVVLVWPSSSGYLSQLINPIPVHQHGEGYRWCPLALLVVCSNTSFLLLGGNKGGGGNRVRGSTSAAEGGGG